MGSIINGNMLPTPDRIRRARIAAIAQALVITVIGSLAAVAVASIWPQVIAVVIGVVWGWWSLRRWRRRARIARSGLAPDDLAVLHARVAGFRRLGADDQARFARLAAVFLDEVPIHGVGCQPTHEDHLLVAASAVIPIMGFPAFEYDGLQQILLRPEHFDATFSGGRDAALNAVGMVADGGLFSGTVILSLPELRNGFADGADGHNVGIHEFAHLVDRSSGMIDGVPGGLPASVTTPWVELIRANLAGRAGRRLLHAYGYTNPAEFFAVGSEWFFERPEQMRDQQPELYALLTRIYGQKTAGRRTRTRLLKMPLDE